MKILFLHIPARSDGGSRKTSRLFGMIMPVGILALADFLRRTGHHVEVIHDGIEAAADPKYRLTDAVRESAAGLVAVSLYFHHQSAAVAESVEKIKKDVPGTRIVIGGVTASFFYREIMQSWNAVDFVIRGDGEIPLWALAQAADAGSDLSHVPNLSYRRGGHIVHNHMAYQANKAMLDRLDFSNLAMLKHSSLYGGAMSWRREDGFAAYLKNRYFYLSPGRGCSVNCAYCAGAAASNQRIHGRRRPVFRSAQRLAGDIKHLLSYGLDRFYICFDPPVEHGTPYRALMRILRKDRLDVSLVFEAYGRLPSEDFLSDFSRTFRREHSALVFSPDTADEQLRRFYKGTYFSNRALEACLARCSSLKINTTLYFALLPRQGFAGLKRSHAWAKSLADKYGCGMAFLPIEIEPGAPWHLHPEAYGIKPTCKTLDDFVARARARDYSKHLQDPGFEFPGFKKQLEYIISEGLVPNDHVPG